MKVCYKIIRSLSLYASISMHLLVWLVHGNIFMMVQKWYLSLADKKLPVIILSYFLTLHVMGMTKPLLLPKINYLPALWNALLQTMHIRKQNFLVEVKWVKKSPFQGSCLKTSWDPTGGARCGRGGKRRGAPVERVPNLWPPEPLAAEGKGAQHPRSGPQNCRLLGQNTARAPHTQRLLPAAPCPPRSKTELN